MCCTLTCFNSGPLKHTPIVPAVLRNDEFWLRYFFHVDEFLRAWEEQHAQASRRSSSDESYEMVESVARVDEVEQVQTAVSVDEGGQASTGASGSKARVPNVGGPNVDSASPATSTIV